MYYDDSLFLITSVTYGWIGLYGEENITKFIEEVNMIP